MYTDDEWLEYGKTLKPTAKAEQNKTKEMEMEMDEHTKRGDSWVPEEDGAWDSPGIRQVRPKAANVNDLTESPRRENENATEKGRATLQSE